MPLRLALGVRGTVAGHRLGALEGGGYLPPSNASLGGFGARPPWGGGVHCEGFPSFPFPHTHNTHTTFDQNRSVKENYSHSRTDAVEYRGFSQQQAMQNKPGDSPALTNAHRYPSWEAKRTPYTMAEGSDF